MKYKPVYIEENVNVSKESPLKKTFVLLLGIIVITVISYFALGILADVIVVNLPPETEKKVGNLLWKPPVRSIIPKKEAKLQIFLEELVAELPEKEQMYHYKVYLIKKDEFNAFAAPGRNIGVYEGLYKELENKEEELAFVLAHELGHQVNKDPLRAVSRSFLITIVSQILLGDNNSISSLVSGSVTHMNLCYSRSVETKADLFAAGILKRKYGDVSGAIEFMERMGKKQKLKLPQFIHYFSTHPASEDRKKAIEEYSNL